MDDQKKKKDLASFLKEVPPVKFCCVYGSTLHPNNRDQGSMVDYILANLKLNGNHYASWIRYLGGAKLVRGIADDIGVGVHFNPFVSLNDKMRKYGVIRINDLINDILNWQRFYLSGRLQQPEELYGKICQLSYMGDVRILFAEDTSKVMKIVQGQFRLFHSMYRPFLEEYETKNILRFHHAVGTKESYCRSIFSRHHDWLKRSSSKMHAERSLVKSDDFRCKAGGHRWPECQ